MLHTPATGLRFDESGSEDGVPLATDSLIPNLYYLVRTNLPGLCFEIENPEMELPVVRFNFKGDGD